MNDKLEAIQAISRHLTRWQEDDRPNSDPKRYVKEPLTYLLRMRWLSRADKMNEQDYEGFDLVSRAFLPPETQYGKSKIGDVAMRGHNHYMLADQLFEGLWAFYISAEQNVLPKPKAHDNARLKDLFRLLKGAFGKTS